MNILICSQQHEFQVKEVCKKLKKLGANPVLFERYRKDHFISYYFHNNKTHAMLNIGGKKYQLTEAIFPAVWYRPKPMILSEIPGEATKIEEKFCINEWRPILQSLDIYLSKSKWVNPLAASMQASNKAYQLNLAIKLGLNVPHTIITNDVNDAVQLFNSGRVVYKTLSSFFTAKKAIYTNELEKEGTLKCGQQIAMAPGIFQEYCHKQYELRVTIIGNQVFTVKVNSQQHQATTIDWRRQPDKNILEPGNLMAATYEKLLSFHKQAGLIFAAYDIVVDENGKEIFLECNPSGQWLWLEEDLDLDISQAMAKELLLI